MPNPQTAIVSQAGMDGNDGSWAILYGDQPIAAENSMLQLALDEDVEGDAERRHTDEQVADEQVAFLILAPSQPPPRRMMMPTRSTRTRSLKCRWSLAFYRAIDAANESTAGGLTAARPSQRRISSCCPMALSPMLRCRTSPGKTASRIKRSTPMGSPIWRRPPSPSTHKMTRVDQVLPPEQHSPLATGHGCWFFLTDCHRGTERHLMRKNGFCAAKTAHTKRRTRSNPMAGDSGPAFRRRPTRGKIQAVSCYRSNLRGRFRLDWTQK